MKSWVRGIFRFKTETSGVTLVEYGVAIAMAVAVGTAGFTLLAGAITTQINTADTIVSN